MILYLLVFIPISLALRLLTRADQSWVFCTAVIGIIPLAELVRKATEQLAKRVGSALGGLLNVTFGNAPELVLALSMLAAGDAQVAKAQVTGSIIGNSLLGLGLAALIGGWKRDHQSFNRQRGQHMSGLLILVLFALLIPAMFDYTFRRAHPHLSPDGPDQQMSLWVAGMLLFLYAANLLYTLVTHRDVFRSAQPPADEPNEPHIKPWPVWKSVALLFGATLFVAIESELISSEIASTASQLGISQFFLGITVLALVGNAAEYFSAIYFARENQIGMVMSITVGSTIQIALFIAPVLVIASHLLGHPMTLVFTSPLELVSIAAAAFAVNTIAQDGETTWFEGMLLIGVYVILAITFYFVGLP